MFKFTSDKKIEAIEKMIKDNHREVIENHRDFDTRLDNLEKVALAHDMNLEEHMKRSERNEELIEIARAEHRKTDNKLNTHVSRVEGAFKLLGVIFSVIGLGIAFIKAVN